jgi:heme-degrading monooxygenase HmoA
MISVYLASDSKLQGAMRMLREKLDTRGIVVTSRWLDNDFTLNWTKAQLIDEAHKDLIDIDEAKYFILYNPKSHHRGGTGGRHFETGYAWATGKPIIYCSEEVENVFHNLAEIHLVMKEKETFNDFVDALANVIHSIKEDE